jgi:hypothetical protein
LVEKPEEYKRTWEDNIKIDIMEIDWINLAQDKKGYETLDSINCWEFVE